RGPRAGNVLQDLHFKGAAVVNEERQIHVAGAAVVARDQAEVLVDADIDVGLQRDVGDRQLIQADVSGARGGEQLVGLERDAADVRGPARAKEDAIGPIEV